jgi:hypothetical protein
MSVSEFNPAPVCANCFHLRALHGEEVSDFDPPLPMRYVSKTADHRCRVAQCECLSFFVALEKESR